MEKIIKFWCRFGLVLCCYAMIGTHNNVTEAMDLSIKDGDLRSVVQGIGRSGHMDVAGSEQLEGHIDITLTGVTPLEALEKIATLKGYTLVQEGKQVYFISPKDGTAKGDLIITPVHIRADKAAKVFTTIVPEKQVGILPDTNQIVVYGTLGERSAISKLMASIDKEPEQVSLQVRVVAVNTSYIKDMGIQWAWLGLTGSGEDSTNSYGAIRFGRAPNGGTYKFFFSPSLHLQEDNGASQLIAEPNIVAMNGEEAKILIGDRIPVLVETTTGTTTKTTVDYTDTGIKLTYTPYISSDGYIDATVRAEVSTPHLVTEMKAYRITTREASTRVRLRDGETLVIGGLMDSRNEETMRKIPILGDLPLFGKLFRSARKTKDHMELIILLRAMRQPEQVPTEVSTHIKDLMEENINGKNITKR